MFHKHDHTQRRKDAHLNLCATQVVEPANNQALFNDLHLVHQALPELREGELDTRQVFLGKTLAYPLLLCGMSGGTPRAGVLNKELAALAEEFQIGFGVGSQRVMLTDPDAAETFRVRSEAPHIVLLGNLGIWQARSLGQEKVQWLMDDIGADAMAIHLNPAQEMIQPEGDRDFHGGWEILESLAKVLGNRLVVKETGCGINPTIVRRLREIGVSNIDLSGMGGTSWLTVESLRAEGELRTVGETFSGWGIPTAACVASAAPLFSGHGRIIASGGIRDGLAVAKALALGADLAGVALPIFRAWYQGGMIAARMAIAKICTELRLAMVLTGSQKLSDLIKCPRIVGPTLTNWVTQLSKVY